MATILNTYADPNTSLAKSLTDLGNSMWGPQAAMAEYAKQKARGALRNNQSIDALQNAARNPAGLDFNDPNVRAGIIGAENPRAIAQGNLTIQGNRYGATAPQTANAAAGAGESYGSTGQGFQEHEANQRQMNDMTTRRDMALKQYQFDHAPYAVADPNDPTRSIITTQSQAVGQNTPVTKDTIVAGALQRGMQPQGGGAVPYPMAGVGAPTPVSASAAPQNGASPDPFINVAPSIRGAAGVNVPQQQMVNPSTREIGVSRDGGYTVDLPDGRRVAAASRGFQPVSEGEALAQSRDNVNRSVAAQPLAGGDPMRSQAAQDAQAATGLGPWMAKEANAHMGAIPFVPSIVQAVTGSPEIAPGIQRAQNRLEVLAQQARSTLLGATGRQTVAAQKWVDEILPQGHAFDNPATAAKDISTVVDAMKADYLQEQQLAQTTTDPAERQKLLQHMHQIQSTVGLFTRPPAEQPQQGVAPAQAAAPQAQAPQQDQGVDPTPHMQAGPDGLQYVDTNQGRFFLRNGQWSK